MGLIRTRTFIGILLAIFLLPVFASAQTLEELQAQVNALLLRVQQLQQELNTGSSGSGTPAGCPLIGRILTIGSTGEDVTRLQQFLARDAAIYPEGLITGYFGPLTEAAVKRWQVAYNIVSSGSPGTTGFGQVGPRTVAAMSLQCSTGGGGGGAPTVGGFIRVTPIAGVAPLLVTIDATVNTVTSCSSAVYTVDYGDNTMPTQITVPAGNCQQLIQTLKHTYQMGGTYQITLSSGAHRTSAVVNVSGAETPSASDSISANPTSGAAPLSVTFSGTINSSRSCDGGTYTLLYGDGQSTALPYPADGCQAFSYSVNHQYAAAGTFTARLFKGTQTTTASAGVDITVSGGTSAASYGIVSITPAVGGNPRAASVQVAYPVCAAYSLDWGDGTLPVSVATKTTGCSGTSSTATHGHTYAADGNYTIKLKDGSGTVRANTAISTFIY